MIAQRRRHTHDSLANPFRLIGMGVFLGLLMTTAGPGSARAGEEGESRIVPVEMREPSGAAWHPQRQSLLVISDEGELVELDNGFQVRARYRLYGDLECVAVHPETGAVFIGDEGNGAILEYDLDGKRVVRVITIDFRTHEDFAGGVKDNQGLEGLAVIRIDDVFHLVGGMERNPPRLIILDADISRLAQQRVARAAEANRHEPLREATRITDSIDVGLLRLSGLTAHPDGESIVVIATGEQLIRQCQLDGKVIASLTAPGSKPEGICILPDGRAVITHDVKKGALTLISDLPGQLAASRAMESAE